MHRLTAFVLSLREKGLLTACCVRGMYIRMELGALPSSLRPSSSSPAHTHTEGKPVRLMRSPDRVKDQTYFLSRLRQDQLSRATFPIGEYTKQEVRACVCGWSVRGRLILLREWVFFFPFL